MELDAVAFEYLAGKNHRAQSAHIAGNDLHHPRMEDREDLVQPSSAYYRVSRRTRRAVAQSTGSAPYD